MENVMAYLPVILVVSLAVILRLRRSRKEASAQIVALQKKVAALEQRTRELERAQIQTPSPVTQILPDEPELTVRLPLFAQGQREMDKAFERLTAMKAKLPFDETVDQKYVEELDSIIISLERASGWDLGRWLGISSQEKQAGIRPCNRDVFRLKILSLLAFCTYQNYHPQLPTIISPTRRPSRLIH